MTVKATSIEFVQAWESLGDMSYCEECHEFSQEKRTHCEHCGADSMVYHDLGYHFELAATEFYKKIAVAMGVRLEDLSESKILAILANHMEKAS